MSLDFSYAKIKNQEIVTTHPEDLDKPSGQRYHPVFNQIVWSMLVIGVSKITEDNLKMVQDRFAQYQKALGPLLDMNGSSKGVYITDADIAMYVGLSTNVTQKTDKQWLESLGEMLLREAYYRTTTHQPQPSAYDLTDYMSMKKEDGTYYVQ